MYTKCSSKCTRKVTPMIVTHIKMYSKSTCMHKSHCFETGSSLHHAPHPLSKKPEVNSFPYPVSLSHPAPVTASGFNSWHTQFSTKCLNLKFPLEHSVHIISSYLCAQCLCNHRAASWSAPEWAKGTEGNASKDPSHKSFLYGGVCSFVCAHHDPGSYSCTGDWENEIACLHREASVPGDSRETTPLLLPGHVTTDKSGNQKPKQLPWLLLLLSKYTAENTPADKRRS